MRVCFFVNRGYLLAFLIAVYSLSRETNLRGVRVTLGFFDDELAYDEAKIRALCGIFGVQLEMVSIPSNSIPANADFSGHFGRAAYGKIFMAERIPGPHLYSDVDVFFRGNNVRLLTLPAPSEGHLGAVSIDSALVHAGKRRLGTEEFFSGLLHWPQKSAGKSSNGLTLRCGEVSTWNFETPHSTHDQAVLNKLFERRLVPISPQFCQLDFPYRRELEFQDGIVHYFGNWKPWHVDDEAVDNCLKSGCGWSLWFDARSKLRVIADRVGEGPWLSELESAAKAGASSKLEFLQTLKRGARVLNLSRVLSFFVRSFSSREIHGFHRTMQESGGK